MRIVRQTVSRMMGDKLSWARPLALLMDAGVCAGMGERDRAVALLNQVATEGEDQNMHGCEAAARYRCGQLVGGDQGREMREAAKAWFQAQGIVDHRAMLNVLAPGYWD